MDKCEDRPYPEAVVPHFGQAALGANRWPRWKIECKLARLLLAANSVSLFGLRRIGKSSVLAGIEMLIREQGAVPVTLELQGSHRIEALVGKLVEACEREKQHGLVEKIRDIYTGATLKAPAAVRAAYRLFSGGKETDDAASGVADVLPYLEMALGPLGDRLRQHDKKVILILDELPFFCQNLHGQGGAQPRHIAALVSELRRWRREGLTMLLAGSIGFHRLERKLGIDPNLFADLTHETLAPLDDAERMIAALARGCRFDFWTEAHTLAIAAAPPVAYPGFFQAIFLDLEHAAVRRSLTVDETAALSARATQKQLEKNFFLQFDERLDYYDPAEQDAAMKLFRALGASAGSAAAKDLGVAFPEDWQLSQRTKLLTALTQDDFVEKLSEKRIAFASPMVAAWWDESDALNG